MTRWSHRIIRSPFLYGGLFLLTLLWVAPADLGGHLFSEPTPEDYLWIQGEMDRLPYFTRHRYIQRYLQHDLARPLFATEPSRITQFGVLIHLLNTVLLFGVFVRLFRTLRRPRSGTLPAALLGAVAAGWVFYFNRTLAPIYISAHSYLLVVTFALISIYLHLHYLRSKSPIYWVCMLMAYALGILCNLFAVGLPLIWLLCEGLAWSGPRGNHPVRSVLWRYAAALAVPAAYIAALWGTYGRTLSEGQWEGERGLRILWCIPDYLAYVWIRYMSNDSVLESIEWFPLLPFRVVGAALAVFILAAAIKYRGKLNIWVALLLFLVAWQAMTYPLAIISPQPLNRPWRYYLPVLGLALMAGFVLAALAQRLLRRAPPLLWVPLVLLALVAVPAQQLLAGKSGPKTLAQIHRGELPKDRRLRHCPGVVWCAQVERIHTPEQVQKILKAGGSLACKNLRGLDLSGLDLSGADLRSSNLSAIKAVETRFNGADLRRACLSLAILRRADLTGARLDGGQINNAVIRDTSLDRITARGLVLGGSIFTNCSFSGADLSGVRSTLTTYEKCSLKQTVLTGGALLNSTIQQLEAVDARLDNVSLMHSVIDGATFQGGGLSGADLSRVRLIGVNFVGSDLSGASFELSNLELIKFSGSTLRGTNFTDTRLRRVSFGGADLSHALMTGSGPDARCEAQLCGD